MAIAEMLVERPRLRRSFNADLFKDPLTFLRSEANHLRLALTMLADLAGNLHVSDRDERAASILDYLSLVLWMHTGDEAALIARIEERTAANDDPVWAMCDELRAEHRAMEQLLPPVIEGLTALSKNMIPPSPQAFVLSALILSEFLRLHVEFEIGPVLNAAKSALTEQDLESLGREMAFRRGMRL